MRFYCVLAALLVLLASPVLSHRGYHHGGENDDQRHGRGDSCIASFPQAEGRYDLSHFGDDHVFTISSEEDGVDSKIYFTLCRAHHVEEVAPSCGSNTQVCLESDDKFVALGGAVAPTFETNDNISRLVWSMTGQMCNGTTNFTTNIYLTCSQQNTTVRSKTDGCNTIIDIDALVGCPVQPNILGGEEHTETRISIVGVLFLACGTLCIIVAFILCCCCCCAGKRKQSKINSTYMPVVDQSYAAPPPYEPQQYPMQFFPPTGFWMPSVMPEVSEEEVPLVDRQVKDDEAFARQLQAQEMNAV